MLKDKKLDISLSISYRSLAQEDTLKTIYLQMNYIQNFIDIPKYKHEYCLALSCDNGAGKDIISSNAAT